MCAFKINFGVLFFNIFKLDPQKIEPNTEKKMIETGECIKM